MPAEASGDGDFEVGLPVGFVAGRGYHHATQGEGFVFDGPQQSVGQLLRLRPSVAAIEGAHQVAYPLGYEGPRLVEEHQLAPLAGHPTQHGIPAGVLGVVVYAAGGNTLGRGPSGGAVVLAAGPYADIGAAFVLAAEEGYQEVAFGRLADGGGVAGGEFGLAIEQAGVEHHGMWQGLPHE